MKTLTNINTHPYLPHTFEEAAQKIKELTVWTTRLPQACTFEDLLKEYGHLAGRVRMLASGGIEKYLYWCKTFNYPMLDGARAYKCAFLPEYIRNFVTYEDRVLVIPAWTVNGNVYRLSFRSVFTKAFRFYSPLPHVPHGLLRESKPYKKPWLLVESTFDSDWLSGLYLYTVSSSGVSGINREGLDLLANTTEQIVIALDNDKAGESRFYTLRSTLLKFNPNLQVTKLDSPYGKDFGDIASLVLTQDRLNEYDLYRSMVLNDLCRLGLC